MSRSSAARRSRMETISARPSTFARAAASSIASGSPSTRRTISRRQRDGLGVRLESVPRRPRTLEKELHGRGAERRDRDPHLARDVKRLAARRQDPDLRDSR